MKNIFKEITLVDALSYLFVGLFSLGAILLLIGFFVGTDVNYVIGGISEKATVSKILSGKSTVVALPQTDITNLFTLHNSLQISDLYQSGSGVMNLINCAIAGFSFMMISLSIIVFFTGWVFIDWIIEKVKSSKGSK